ncbi:hypothetical protein SAMN05444000_1261 [Shimia gijangensis]|uniref:Uncharacterized protein n=1 Tax=Shimia gijangensis TaxID=1470563 RepID=A0A1M6RMQ0_9RHOB|nr:hypothetical protein SAMN05444000_1261 [Shimia gijangensis]
MARRVQQPLTVRRVTGLKAKGMYCDGVQAVASSPRSAVSLLTRLACCKRIAPYPGDPQYVLLRSLKANGVLENEPKSPRGRNYVLTLRYRRARDQLASSYVIQRSKKSKSRRRLRRNVQKRVGR